MGMRGRNLDLFEKSLAGIIDVASVLVAYNVGMARLGLAYGMVYAGMDAFVVVWLSRPITGVVRRLNHARRGDSADAGPGGRPAAEPGQTGAVPTLPSRSSSTGYQGVGTTESAWPAAADRPASDD
jgi:hypothetical protein